MGRKTQAAIYLCLCVTAPSFSKHCLLPLIIDQAYDTNDEKGIYPCIQKMPDPLLNEPIKNRLQSYEMPDTVAIQNMLS